MQSHEEIESRLDNAIKERKRINLKYLHKEIQSSGLWGQIVKKNPGFLIVAYSNDGFIVKVNDEIHKTGYTAEEVEGMYVQELIHPNDLEETLKIFDYWDDKSISFKNRWIGKDGQIVYLTWIHKLEVDYKGIVYVGAILKT
jgi:PAS domain S-box-containing protein